MIQYYNQLLVFKHQWLAKQESAWSLYVGSLQKSVPLHFAWKFPTAAQPPVTRLTCNSRTSHQIRTDVISYIERQTLADSRGVSCTTTSSHLRALRTRLQGAEWLVAATEENQQDLSPAETFPRRARSTCMHHQMVPGNPRHALWVHQLGSGSTIRSRSTEGPLDRSHKPHNLTTSLAKPARNLLLYSHGPPRRVDSLKYASQTRATIWSYVERRSVQKPATTLDS